MKKRICEIMFLIGIAAIFIYGAFQQNRQDFDSIKTTTENEVDIDGKRGMELFETEVFESEIVQAELPETENTETEVSETEITEMELTEEQKAELSTHYGTYRITEYCSTVYSSRNDNITDQEADMMLGRIVEITPERLVTYGPERGLGTRNGRYGFDNYAVETYREDNPRYGYREISSEREKMLMAPELERAISPEYYEQLEGVIITSDLREHNGQQESYTYPDKDPSHPSQWMPEARQSFYTFADKDILVLYSHLANEYFFLERCGEKPKEGHPKWDSWEADRLLEEVYGAYKVTEFMPTKFFPFEDHRGEELSKEEADMTIGRTVTISEDLFVTYDNWWAFNLNRPCLAEAEVENPDYRVKTVWADEIYGIRDGMLPDDLAQQEYVEIDVYPGFVSYWRILPQMYLVDDGRIILYAMGQYFLLERTEDEKAVTHEKDLSAWLGRYAYTEGDSTYRIEIREESPGQYEAEIEADVDRVTETGYVEKWHTRVKADVSGNSERISFTLKDNLEGDKRWNIGTALLRFKRDAETGDIYTYWGNLYFNIVNLDTHDKEAGRICFVKE